MPECTGECMCIIFIYIRLRVAFNKSHALQLPNIMATKFVIVTSPLHSPLQLADNAASSAKRMPSWPRRTSRNSSMISQRTRYVIVSSHRRDITRREITEVRSPEELTTNDSSNVDIMSESTCNSGYARMFSIFDNTIYD